MWSLVGNIRFWAGIIAVLFNFRQITLSQQPTILRVPTQYQTIQSAINTAHTGDTIIIDRGIYFENLTITKNIVLASLFLLDGDTAHISRTIIDGSRVHNKLRGSAILITGSADTLCVVYGLTIQGGTGTYIHLPNDPVYKDWITGGGICVNNAGARIAHNIVRDNHIRSVGQYTCTYGAGISAGDSTSQLHRMRYVIIENNLVTKNTLSGRWVEVPGIAVAQPGIVRHNTIIDNSSKATVRAPGGGLGLYINVSYDIVAEGNYIRRNSAGIGGGILVGGGVVTRGRAIIKNNIITENDVFEVGGGVHIAENVWAMLLNNTIVGNRAGATGGGLNVAAGGTATIINNIIWNNTPHQITSLSSVRAVNNLVQGGFHGENTIDADPLFVPSDTMFRLQSGSPAICTGARQIFVGKVRYDVPEKDFSGTPRLEPGKNYPDLGAVSVSGLNPAQSAIRAGWKKEADSRLRLTIAFRQFATAQFSADSTHVVKAGQLKAQVIVNDSLKFDIDSLARHGGFILPPGRNVLDVEVMVRGLAESRLLNSYFRLEGLDAINNRIPRNRQYVYTQYVDIPTGTYRLTFYPADEFGLFDAANIKSITITVLQPWYQRWWSYVLMTLLGAGVIAYIYSLKIQRLNLERQIQKAFSQQQIENEERQRKRLASELHDGLGQELLIVSNELQSFLQNGGKERDGLQRAAEMVQESIEDVRSISSELHPHHIDRLGFCAAVEAMVEKLFHASTIAMECRCAPIDRLIPKENKIHLYRIIQESLTNIIRHSSATSARLEITQHDHAIIIIIEDNGKGFDIHEFESEPLGVISSKEYVRGFGINSMNERARITGAQMDIITGNGTGTVIRITAPIAKSTS
jgi:signal transduction histidine kinase